MAYIKLNNDFPGIVGLLYHKPVIGKAINGLVQRTMRGPSSLSPAERELIAAHVSNLNDCAFCRDGHAATASALLQDSGKTVACVIGGQGDDEVSPRMKALLDIAARVQESGRAVSPSDVERAKSAGATDDDVHDAVLVAAVFSMCNRYVDGLGTETPSNEAFYRESGEFLASKGYRAPSAIGRFFVDRMLKKYRSSEAVG